MKAKAKKKPSKKEAVKQVEPVTYYAIDVSGGFEDENLIGETVVLGPCYSKEDIEDEIRAYATPDDDDFQYDFIIVKQESTVVLRQTKTSTLSWGEKIEPLIKEEELSGWRDWLDDEKQD